MPIAQRQLIAAVAACLARQRHRAHDVSYVLHFTIIGTGVHKERTTNAARDAAGELQPRETVRRRRIRDILEQRPRARDETAALHTDIGHGPVELHHGATDALVTHEHIRAVAEDDKWQLILVNEAQYLLQLRHRGRKNEKIGEYERIQETE